MPRQALQQSTIRVATAADAEAVADIYNYYVTDTVVTFEEKPVSPTEMAERINEVASASLPWLVAELEGQVLGYAYASKWKVRCAYRFSTEITVYLERSCQGLGLGSRLYGELFPLLAGRGIHAVIGGIALPNPASVALHEKFGLEKVAHFREVGFKSGKWIDVGYWHRIL
jgi:L-amino acid N-acyltransferase YncA